MEKELKYKEIIAEVAVTHNCTCPPISPEEINKETFRYVYEVDPKEISHLPSKKKNPKRKLPTGEEQCSSCGISCYDTKQNAVNFYNDLLKSNPLIYKNIGDSLANGMLDEECGLQSDKDNVGHFDLYEYVDFKPALAFSFVERLITENEPD